MDESRRGLLNRRLDAFSAQVTKEMDRACAKMKSRMQAVTDQQKAKLRREFPELPAEFITHAMEVVVTATCKHESDKMELFLKAQPGPRMDA